MLKLALALRYLVAMLLVCVFTGCQAWQSSSALPGLLVSKAERQAVDQAKNDPFPSPSDVGMSAPE